MDGERLMSRQQLFDLALAAALALLSISILGDLEGIGWPSYALAALHVAPVAVRRRWPVAAVGVAALAAVWYGLLDYPTVGLTVTPLVIAYTAGAELSRPTSLVALACVEGAGVIAAVPGDLDAGTMAGNAVSLAALWLLGDSTRRRREVTALHVDRAAQLERTASEVAARAAAEERLRIARELHDVVAHSMSVISIQAGTARLVLDSDVSKARDALRAIEVTSREAMDEMRRLLGVLRADGAGADGERDPAPGLGQLDELVAQTAANGSAVTVRIEGERRPLAPGADVAAYRILQEALTNVRKHAPGAPCTVVVTYDASGVRIDVTDEGGPAPTAHGSGHGLVGMRERAALYSGTIEAGPTTSGWRVTATVRDGAPT